MARAIRRRVCVHDPQPRGAWTDCPLNGCVHVARDPGAWGERGKKVSTGDLAGRAEGARIEVLVDCDRHTLGFAVDGAPMTLLDARKSSLSSLLACLFLAL